MNSIIWIEGNHKIQIIYLITAYIYIYIYIYIHLSNCVTRTMSVWPLTLCSQKEEGDHTNLNHFWFPHCMQYHSSFLAFSLAPIFIVKSFPNTNSLYHILCSTNHNLSCVNFFGYTPPSVSLRHSLLSPCVCVKNTSENECELKRFKACAVFLRIRPFIHHCQFH